MSDDLVKRLVDWSEYDEGKINDIRQEAAERIELLSRKLKLLEKTDMYLKTNYPDKTGYYFICGEDGSKDDNGLPERLHVCPAYGVDWMMLYQRTDKTSGPDY